MARRISMDDGILPNRERLISTLLIALKDIVSVNITKTEEPDSAADEAITASKHTNGQRVERTLEKWIPQEGEPHLGRGLEDNAKVNGWSADEMFKTNEEKFGVKSTYNDDLREYTTPLPKDSTPEMELRAEPTAREIEQSKGHDQRQEVDSGRSEEEAFAAVIRPKTTAEASLPTSSSPVASTAERQEVAADTSGPSTIPDTTNTSTTVAASPSTESKVYTEAKAAASEGVSTGSSTKSPADSEAPKSQQQEVVEVNGKKKKVKDVSAEPEVVEAASTPSSETPPPEAVKTEENKRPQTPEDSILSKSKLNPTAKEFKPSPRTQKPAPSPQPAQYVPVVAAQPFSPTSMRPPAVPGGPFPPQQLMMVAPQQFPMYRGKQPFNKPRSQSYGGREQGDSSPFISAAVATGSPIITPGGAYPQQVYMPPPQVAYVQSPAGMVPQQAMQQYVVPAGHAHPRFIAPVSSPAGGATVPMSQTYQDGSHVPVYALPGAATPPGQPQPSPSQQGQFIFASAVPQMPGQPQAAGPHQGQVTPGQPQFTPTAPLMYIPNANVPTSATSAPVSYITGTYSG